MAPARVRRLVLAIVAGLVATLGAATAAAATDTPVLTALSVSTTTVTPPGTVRLSYATTSQTSTLGFVRAIYTSPVHARGNVTLEARSAALTGVLEWKIPDGFRNATYTLSEVTVMSSDLSAGTIYRRDGTTSRGGTHSFDLPSMDVTVTGSNEDLRGPVLTSVSVTTHDVQPGQPVTVSWSSDDASPVVSASFYFKGVTKPSGVTLSSTSATELAAGGITRPLSVDVYNDRHALATVSLRDTLGNLTTWYADGRMTNVPYDAALEKGSHELDFASVGFSVTGSTYDRRAPVLTSLSLDRRTAPAGGRIKVSYVVDEDTLPLEQVVLRYARPGTSTTILGLVAGNLPASGSFVDVLPADVVGDVELASVELMDRNGYQATYQRDGTVITRPIDSKGRHSLDLSAFDIRVTPSALSAVARSRPHSAALRWSVPTGQGAQLAGYRITVNPGGRVITVPSNGADGQQTVVTGLTNARKYTFTVTPQSTVGPGPTSTVSTTPLLSGNIWGAGDVNGDRRNDLFAMVQPPANGVVKLYRGTGKPGLGMSSNVADWTGYRPHPADTSYGYPSHLVVADWGTMEVARVDRSGRPLGSTDVGSGWGGMRFIDGSADFTGDQVADIVAVNPSGVLYLYRGRSGGTTFASGTRVGAGWDTMQTVFAASDVTGDRRADLMAVDATGRLRIYPGNGKGGFSASRVVGPGWGAFGAVFSARDLTGDGRVDIGAVTMAGDLYVYRGNGKGGFPSRTKIGHGWHNFF